MNAYETTPRSQRYQIQVRGTLDAGWENWLHGEVETCSTPEPCSQITIAVPDQAALRGVLNKLWDLNLTLISVVLMADMPKDAPVLNQMEDYHDC